MNRRTIAVPLALAALLSTVPQVAHAGSADPPSGSATYQCLLGSRTPEAVKVTLGLDSPPARVRSGQRLSLGGTLTVALPTKEALSSALTLAKGVTIKAADFTVPTTPGPGAKVDEVRGTPVNPGMTFTLTASVKTKPFQVPTGASHVSVGLPSQNTVPNPFTGTPNADGTPKKVAFTLDLGQTGLATSRQLACWLGDGQQAGQLVDIPVARTQQTPAAGGHSGGQSGPGRAAATAGGAGTDGSAVPTAAPGTGGSAMAAAPPAAAADPAGTGDSVSADPSATSPDTGPPAAAAPAGGEVTPAIAGAQASYATVPAATKDAGTYLPFWLILLLGSLVPLAAVGYAVFMRRRLRRAAGGSLVRSGRRALNLGGAR